MAKGKAGRHYRLRQRPITQVALPGKRSVPKNKMNRADKRATFVTGTEPKTGNKPRAKRGKAIPHPLGKVQDGNGKA